MGACYFTTFARGSSLKEAFDAAVREAEYEHGHGGYTGTIAEKGGDGYVVFPTPEGLRALSGDQLRAQGYAYGNNYADDPRVVDKWGPCGAATLREPSKIERLSKAKAEAMAREKWGSSAKIVTTRKSKRHPTVTAFVQIEERAQSYYGGHSNTVVTTKASAVGADAEEARSKLFAEPGLFVFFGWASS